MDLDLPRGVLIVLIRRGPETFVPQGGTVIAADDRLLVAAEHTHHHFLDATFAEPATPPREEGEI